MNTSTKVPYLQDMAFEVFYEDLLNKATPMTVRFVRACIEQQLGGTMRKRIREKCLSKLNMDYEDRLHRNWDNDPEEDHMLEQYPNTTVILDCILDETFLELSTALPCVALESLSEVLSVISHQSPKLEELDITFHPVSDATDNIPALLIRSIPHSPLSSLSCLTLQFKDNAADIWECEYYNSIFNHSKSIFSIIGKYCPRLSSLRVCGFDLEKRDVLGLIVVGELAEVIFPADNDGWSHDAVLPALRVPPEFLNPLCSTLKILDFEEYHSLKDSVKAFALRHLPKVGKLKPEFDEAASLVKVVHMAEKKLNETKQDFGEICRASALSIGLEIHSSAGFIPDEGFTFPNKLEILRKVPLNDADMLRGIGRLCPQLKHVKFVGDSHSIDELLSVLNRWPEMERIILSDVNSRCVQPVLNVFGSALRVLELDNCQLAIDLAHLASCTVLQKLEISCCTIICEGNDPTSRWTSQTFLPSLKVLKTWPSCCLGVWAPLLEKKSTLKQLALVCCHIGTNVRIPAYNPRLEWGQIPKSWSNLEYLRIGHCTAALTMTEVSSLIPQMKKLKAMWLPWSVYEKDPALFDNISVNYKKSVKILVYTDFDDFACPYLQIPD